MCIRDRYRGRPRQGGRGARRARRCADRRGARGGGRRPPDGAREPGAASWRRRGGRAARRERQVPATLRDRGTPGGGARRGAAGPLVRRARRTVGPGQGGAGRTWRAGDRRRGDGIMTIGNRAPVVRPSGRRPDELRAVSLTLGLQKWAEGSCRIRVGDTEVLCAATIEDRVPPHLRGKGTGWVTAEYAICLLYTSPSP